MSYLNASNAIDRPVSPVSELTNQWRQLVEAELKGASFEKKLVNRTFEGIALRPVYTREDIANLHGLQTAPGQAPFLRGSFPVGVQNRHWQFAQETAAATPSEFAAARASDSSRGPEAIVIDAPTQLGNIHTLRTSLDHVDLAATPIHVFAGANALPAAAIFLALAAERRCEWANLTGSVVADPLSSWVTEAKLPLGLERELDALAGWTRWAVNHAPNLKTISINGRAWAETGGNAAQELACALATAAEYLRELGDRGISVETAARRMLFSFASGPQFFTEIAKLRACRMLWTRVVVAYGAKPETATSSHVHVATSRWNKTLLDPHVNMLRVTTEALSAVLGGCDSLHIAPFDEATGGTTDFSRRIAGNVHVLLAEEFGFTQTADPSGGSWYIENLTDQLARKAWELFQTFAAEGGFVRALREGIPQTLVSEAALEKADAVGKRRLALIGTNVFPNLKEPSLPPKLPPSAPAGEAASALPKVASRAAWPQRFEAALASARAGASLEQLARLSGAKARKAEPIATISPFRAAAGFEFLRASADAYAAQHGHRPRVFLAKIGPTLQHKARADFATGFFATGGFEILAKQAFDSPQSAGEAAARSGAPVTVLCSTDDTYDELVPAFVAAAGAAKANLKIVLAGLPTDPAKVAAYQAAGVDEFIHIRANAHTVLTKLLRQIGAIA